MKKKLIFIIAIVTICFSVTNGITSKSQVSLFSKKGTGNPFIGSLLNSKRMMFVTGVALTTNVVKYLPQQNVILERDFKTYRFVAKIKHRSIRKTSQGTPSFEEYEFFSKEDRELSVVRIFLLKDCNKSREFLFKWITPPGANSWHFKNPEYVVEKGKVGDLILRSRSSALFSDLNSFYFIRGNMVISLKRYDKTFDLENLAKFIDEKLVSELQKNGVKSLQEPLIITPKKVILSYMNKLEIHPASSEKTSEQPRGMMEFFSETAKKWGHTFRCHKGRCFWRSSDFISYNIGGMDKVHTSKGSETSFELFYEDSLWDAQYDLFYSAIFETGAITFEQFTNDYRVVKNADNSIILVGKAQDQGKSSLYLLHGNFFLKIYTGEKDKLAVVKRIDQAFISDLINNKMER